MENWIHGFQFTIEGATLITLVSAIWKAAQWITRYEMKQQQIADDLADHRLEIAEDLANHRLEFQMHVTDDQAAQKENQSSIAKIIDTMNTLKVGIAVLGEKRK